MDLPLYNHFRCSCPANPNIVPPTAVAPAFRRLDGDRKLVVAVPGWAGALLASSP
jgi:hypothetical protein